MNCVPHRIEYKVDAFAPRKLCSRNKVGVTGDQNDLVHLTLKNEGSNVEPDAHIDALCAATYSKSSSFISSNLRLQLSS